MSYRISDRGEAFIKSFEKFRAKAYLDAVGIWTCGWGHTSERMQRDIGLKKRHFRSGEESARRLRGQPWIWRTSL